MNEGLNLAGMRCGNWTSTDTSFFYFKESLYLFSLYFVITATPIGLQGLLLTLLFEITLGREHMADWGSNLGQ